MDATAAVSERCRRCRRPLSGVRSAARGIGPTCWRKMRAEVAAAPRAPDLPYDRRTGDLIVVVDAEGFVHTNFAVPRDEMTGDDRQAVLSRAMMERAGYPLEWLDAASFVSRFGVVFVAPILAAGGGVVRGADLRVWKVFGDERAESTAEADGASH